MQNIKINAAEDILIFHLERNAFKQCLSINVFFIKYICVI